MFTRYLNTCEGQSDKKNEFSALVMHLQSDRPLLGLTQVGRWEP